MLWLTLGTRPDISYAVGQVAKFNADPGPLNWKAVLTIFQYLEFTGPMGMAYKYSISNVDNQLVRVIAIIFTKPLSFTSFAALHADFFGLVIVLCMCLLCMRAYKCVVSKPLSVRVITLSFYSLINIRNDCMQCTVVIASDYVQNMHGHTHIVYIKTSMQSE